MNNISLELNGETINKDCTGTIFVIFQNYNNNLENISYYLFTFDITEDNNNNKDYIKYIIISLISVVIIIIIIIFIINYRKMKKKNIDLQQKVRELSFTEEDSSKDDDNKVTFI